jgi:tetratricopeptide (TPR) repeat protein
MEWSAKASKRLTSFAILPSSKRKKYNDIYSFFTKAGQAYVSQQQYILASEAYNAAASIAIRKLRSTPDALCSLIESTICLVDSREYELAYESLKKVIEQYEFLWEVDAIANGKSKSTIPPSPRKFDQQYSLSKLRSPAPMSPISVSSKSCSTHIPPAPLTPITPLHTDNNSHDISILSKSAPSGMNIHKHSSNTNNMNASKSKNTNSTDSPSSTVPPPLNITVTSDVMLHLPHSAVRSKFGTMNAEEVKKHNVPLRLAPIAVEIAQALWEKLHFSASLDAYEYALKLLQLLDNPHNHKLISPSLLKPSKDLQIYASQQLADRYLRYYTDCFAEQQNWGVDQRLLKRTKTLYEWVGKQILKQLTPTPSSPDFNPLPANPNITFSSKYTLSRANSASISDSYLAFSPTADLHSHPSSSETPANDSLFFASSSYTSSVITLLTSENIGLPPALAKSVISYASPILSTCFFNAALCDAILTNITDPSIHVLATPPFLQSLMNSSIDFAQSDEIKFARQVYGLLCLSASAPAKLVEGGLSDSPADTYRRLLIALWGYEIAAEFMTLSQRYFERHAANPPGSRFYRHDSRHVITPIVDPMSSIGSGWSGSGAVYGMGSDVLNFLTTIAQTPVHYSTVSGYIDIEESSIELLYIARRIIVHNIPRPGQKLPLANTLSLNNTLLNNRN